MSLKAKLFVAFLYCVFLASLLIALCSGCAMRPLSGGRSVVAAGQLIAPQNPKDASRQITDSETTVEYAALAPGVPYTNAVRTISHVHTDTTLGAAQKDVSREVGAKLASMRWMQWVGILVFLFGAASLFWPPLKAIVASVTTSISACVAGIVLMILPVLVVGNEGLLICAALAALAVWLAWWFAHRHGGLGKEIQMLREFIKPPSNP